MALMQSASFERFAGACAILTAIASFLYAVAFVILQNVVLSALLLTAVGMLSSAVLVAVYYRLRQTNAAFALWALVLGIAGALERVMDPRREYRLPDGGRGKRRRRSATPPKQWVASRNLSPTA